MTTECRRSFHVGRGTSWTGAAEALSREFDTVGTSQFLRTHHVWRDDQISCVPMSCSSTTPPSCWSPSCPHLPLRITHGCCSFSFSPVSEVFQICSLLSFPCLLSGLPHCFPENCCLIGLQERVTVGKLCVSKQRPTISYKVINWPSALGSAFAGRVTNLLCFAGDIPGF